MQRSREGAGRALNTVPFSLWLVLSKVPDSAPQCRLLAHTSANPFATLMCSRKCQGAYMCLLYFSGPVVKPMEVSSRTSMSVWLRPVSSQNRYCSLHLAGWHLGRSTSGQPSSQGTHRPPGPPLSLLKFGFTSLELVQRGCFFTSVDKALQVHQDLFPSSCFPVSVYLVMHKVLNPVSRRRIC